MENYDDYICMDVRRRFQNSFNKYDINFFVCIPSYRAVLTSNLEKKKNQSLVCACVLEIRTLNDVWKKGRKMIHQKQKKKEIISIFIVLLFFPSSSIEQYEENP